MLSLSCNCGHTEKGDDRYVVEANMWRHAIKDHGDMLQAMTTEQLADWLRNKDNTLGAQTA